MAVNDPRMFFVFVNGSGDSGLKIKALTPSSYNFSVKLTWGSQAKSLNPYFGRLRLNEDCIPMASSYTMRQA